MMTVGIVVKFVVLEQWELLRLCGGSMVSLFSSVVLRVDGFIMVVIVQFGFEVAQIVIVQVLVVDSIV